MDFQTPIDVCDYMANFLPNNAGIILEPTKGEGNLVNSLSLKGEVIAPDDFFDMKKRKFDNRTVKFCKYCGELWCRDKDRLDIAVSIIPLSAEINYSMVYIGD